MGNDSVLSSLLSLGGKTMKTWQDVDYVLKQASQQADEEYLFGENSIHAKYTKLIANYEEKLKIQEAEIRRMRQIREKKRLERLKAQQVSERC